jgi:hypothetical protein
VPAVRTSAAAFLVRVARRGAENLAHLPVELTQAGKPRRERHVTHGQVGVVEQPPGEVRTPRHGQLAGSDAQLVMEDPPQMPVVTTAGYVVIPLGIGAAGPLS